MIINGHIYSEGIEPIRCKNHKENGISKIVVHSGRFHADDVFCVAMLLMIYPNAEVIRKPFVGDEYNNEPETIVADIGFGKYDHHQPDSEVRADGNRYAACGLVFRDFRGILFDGNLNAADLFERKYIKPVEIDDNGGAGNPLSDTISAFNPAWDSGRSSDEMFAKAVRFVHELIARELDRAEANARASVIVKEALRKSDGMIVVLPEDLPWIETLIETSAVYAVYPSIRGGYNIQCVPEKLGSKASKRLLPEEWVQRKPVGCTFVHTQRFIASFITEADAITAAGNALLE